MKNDIPDPTVLLIPVYNDWESVRLLLPKIDEELAAYPTAVHVVLIDDASTQPAPEDTVEWRFQHIFRVDVLHLRRNFGHQRAIAIGLCHVEAQLKARAVLVMDGDGEDRPRDVPRLLQEFDRLGGGKVLFGERTRRMETITFKFFYHLYRCLHLLLTGLSVRVGNFSVAPRAAVARLVVVSDLWNHYAAAVFRSRIPYATLPLPRGQRLHGKSSMNFVSLVVHGLSAISVFGDIVSVRLLVVSVVAVIACLGLGLFVGGANVGIGIAFVLSVQLLLSAVVLAFATIGSRSNMNVVPLRDAHFFILEARPIYLADERVPLHRFRVGNL